MESRGESIKAADRTTLSAEECSEDFSKDFLSVGGAGVAASPVLHRSLVQVHSLTPTLSLHSSLGSVTPKLQPRYFTARTGISIYKKQGELILMRKERYKPPTVAMAANEKKSCKESEENRVHLEIKGRIGEEQCQCVRF